MRTFLMCLLALVAFAANSILNRSALALSEIGPAAFLGIRITSGAVMLAALVAFRDRRQLFERPDWRGVGALFLYMFGFSYAYVRLETGTGALILFGGVQITMFAGALLSGERPAPLVWLGSLMGLCGLAILFLPGAQAPSFTGAWLMALAAIGWGIYSLLGKGSHSPLAQTARNFVFAAPIGWLLWYLAPSETVATSLGVWLAIASGAFASGIGYAIWYGVLPRLDASIAAIAQLTVPIIALGGGMVFLGEPLTLKFIFAAFLIMGGVVVALRSPARKASTRV